MAHFHNLRSSRYLKPAQQLLDEVVCVSNAVEPGLDEQIRLMRSVGVGWPNSGRSLQLGYGRNQYEEDTHQPVKYNVQIKIDKLEALLHELERRCARYFNELDIIVSSFEHIAGVGTAAPYSALTIQAMSKHFSNLRDAIVDQIHSCTKTLSKDLQMDLSGHSQPWISPRSSNSGTINNTRKNGQNRARSIGLLRAWLFEHMLHPYPDANEKHMLASQTGLTIIQVTNWFINARSRLWKPMIEELYRDEKEDDSHDSDPSS